MKSPDSRRTLYIEIIALISLISAFSLGAVVVIPQIPVGPDEACYVDPAASLFFNQGFTSGSWFAQTHDQFWAANVPLYQFILFGWLKWFGFKMLSVRALNLTLVIISAIILWVGLRRSSWITTSTWRIIMIASMLMTLSVGYMVSSGRHDALCLLIYCSGPLLLSVQPQRLRMILLACVGILIVFSGLHLAVAVVYLAGFSLLATRGKSFLEVFSLGGGIAVGSLLLIILYTTTDSLQGFIASVLPNFAAKNPLASSGTNFGIVHRFSAFRDYSFLAILATGMIVSLTAFWHGIRSRNASQIKYALGFLLLSIGLPLFEASVGIFPVYYSWIAVLPSCLLLYAAASRDLWPLGHINRAILFAGFLASGIAGFPGTVFLTTRYLTDSINKNIEAFVTPSLKATDTAFVSSEVYYPVKTTARRTFTIGWYRAIMTDREKEAVTVVIVPKEQKEGILEFLGGSWYDCHSPFTYPRRNIKPFSRNWFFDENPIVELTMSRRLGDPTSVQTPTN